MTKVTSLRLRKKFSQCCELAEREPVIITIEGRESLVLLSVAEFKRLNALDTRRTHHPADLPRDVLGALDRAEAPEWTARYDEELDLNDRPFHPVEPASSPSQNGAAVCGRQTFDIRRTCRRAGSVIR